MCIKCIYIYKKKITVDLGLESRVLTDVVHGRWRFQRHLWKLVPVMISRFTRTQFSLIIMILTSSMGGEDFSVTLDLGSGVSRDADFINDLLFWRSPRELKISALAVEVVSGDDFSVYKDSVFVNDLWFWHHPRALKISASPWIWDPGMICNSDVVHKRWRFQRELWKLVPVMVSRSTGSRFSLMI